MVTYSKELNRDDIHDIYISTRPLNRIAKKRK